MFTLCYTRFPINSINSFAKNNSQQIARSKSQKHLMHLIKQEVIIFVKYEIIKLIACTSSLKLQKHEIKNVNKSAVFAYLFVSLSKH